MGNNFLENSFSEISLITLKFKPFCHRAQNYLSLNKKNKNLLVIHHEEFFVFPEENKKLLVTFDQIVTLLAPLDTSILSDL